MNNLNFIRKAKLSLLFLFLFILILNLSCGNDPISPEVDMGKLDLEVLGLQPQLSGDITINGPGNYSLHCTESIIIDSLPTGDYQILAAEIVNSLGDTIGVNPDSQLITIQKDQTTNAQVYYQAVDIGTLQISASGLPPGEGYDIVVTSVDNPSVSWNITESYLIDSLLPGSFQIVAHEVVTTSGEIYKPDIITQLYNVVAGVLSEINIVYSPKNGSLSVLIIGLPSGTDADVTVAGTESFYLTESRLFDSLEAGSYTITADEVTSPGGTDYEPIPDSQLVNVVGGDEAFATVDYRPKFGVLFLDITGLPDEVVPDVTIDGPSLSDEIGEAGRWYDSLAPGDYTILAKAVTANDGTKYIPDLDSQVVGVVRGDSSFVFVKYKENKGALSVLIIGLPTGTLADVDVSGTNFPNKNLDQTGLIDSLDPGNYKIIAHEVTATDGKVYKAVPDSLTATVSAGDTTLTTVDYKPKHGVMSVTITGLPEGTEADVSITRDGYSDIEVPYTDNIDSLEPGYYTVAALEVTIADGTVYKPDLASQLIGVLGGDTSYAFIVYEKKYGSLEVVVSGIPEGLEAEIEIVNLDQTHYFNITGSDVIDSMEADTYRINAAPLITLSGDTLTPDPLTQTVQIVGGVRSNAEILYKGSITVECFYAPAPLFPYAVSGGYYTDDNCWGRTDWYQVDSTAVGSLPVGYIRDGCDRFTGQVIDKKSPFTTTVAVSGGASSASGSYSIEFDEVENQLTIITFAQASSNPANSYDCPTQGSAAAIMDLGDQYNGMPNLALQIENTGKDSIDVIVEWTYSIDYTINQDYPGIVTADATPQAALDVKQNRYICSSWSSLPEDIIFQININNPIDDNTGTDTVIVTDPLVVVGLDIYTSATAFNKRLNHPQLGGWLSGSASSLMQGTLIITVKKRESIK